jgi:hypothetical protein
MVIAVILFFLTLAAKLAVDVRLYLSGKPNRHTLGPVIVFVVLVACSWIAGWLTLPLWFLGWSILFNGLYNVLIGQGWWYLGTTARLDRFERRHPWVTIVKYSLFTATILFLWLTNTSS